MRARLLIVTSIGWSLAWTGHAGAQPPTRPPGGCQEFGQNVAGLAQERGRGFGVAASGAARVEPGGIVTIVVAPEQGGLCP